MRRLACLLTWRWTGTELRPARVQRHIDRTVLARLLAFLGVLDNSAVPAALGPSVFCDIVKAFLCATLLAANVLEEEECALLACVTKHA